MKNKKIIIIALTFTLLTFLMVAFITHNYNFTMYIQNHIVGHLEEILAPNEVSFELQINEQVKKVYTIADIFAQGDELGSDDQLVVLKSVVENNGLENCLIVYPDGSAVNQDGMKYYNLNNDDFFESTMNGKFFISSPTQSLVDPTRNVMVFASPIIKNDNVIGSVVYSCWCDTITSMFNLSFLDGQGKIAIVDETGNLLIGNISYVNSNDNLLNYFKSICDHADHLPENCSILKGNRGVFNVEDNNDDSNLIVSYVKLQTGNWYMMSIAPQLAVTKSFSGVFSEQNKMIFVLVCCILVYGAVLLFIAFSDRRSVDKMTGAMSRNHFIRKAKAMLKKNSSKTYVFIKLDVRNFKIINRVHDFEIGNKVIVNMAKALEYVVKNNNGLFCRISIDNFALLLPFEDREKLAMTRSIFINMFRELMGKDFNTIVEFPTGEYIVTPEDPGRYNVFEIMEKINFAHKKAKLRNGNIITDYYQDLEKEAIEQNEIENKMNSAFINQEFKMYLQPKVCLNDGRVCGAEALVRWHENDKIISPAVFVPLFEMNGFIAKIDFYIFEQAAKFLKKMIDNGLDPIKISINFSRIHLNNEDFVAQLKSIVDKYNVPYQYFEIELTETIVFENVNKIIKLIDDLHHIGFTMSMDDFGSGYSSLALLKDIDVDVIKIDRAFFLDTMNNERARIVISSIIDMAAELKVRVVAEGIETEAQVQILKDLKCDVIQGFYYFKPISSDDFDFEILDKYY
ncbi:bifunctional diguanylate cyclase/phosphodiesterase [Anaerorhabdus sp.]|uniref:bifunctional diguanylate cyclase/phosphodiesterase n=1 Tax=Anaerorhabdus sp. TaxID=1872524 RepID=UPI002FCB7256